MLMSQYFSGRIKFCWLVGFASIFFTHFSKNVYIEDGGDYYTQQIYSYILCGLYLVERRRQTCQVSLMSLDKCTWIFAIKREVEDHPWIFLFIVLLARGFWSKIYVFLLQLGNHNICLSSLAFCQQSTVFCRRHPRFLLRPNDDEKQAVLKWF